MEGDGSSSSQVVTWVGLTVEESLGEELHHIQLAVNQMNIPMVPLT